MNNRFLLSFSAIPKPVFVACILWFVFCVWAFSNAGANLLTKKHSIIYWILEPAIIVVPLVLISLYISFKYNAIQVSTGDAILFLIGWFAVLLWIGFWYVRLVTYWLSKRLSKKPVNKIEAPLIYWGLEPIALIVCFALGYFDIYSLIRFKLSEQSLMCYVENVRAGKVDINFEFTHPARQVGLYSINQTNLLPDGTVRMITSEHGVFDRAGFANSPSNSPPRIGEDSYEPIRGQWWIWHESW